MPATATPPDPAAAPPDDQPPVDVAAVRTAVEGALMPGPVPKYEDLREQERVLRGHLGRLLPIATAVVDRMPKGSLERDGAQAALAIARDRLKGGMGCGLCSAHAHVRRLAYSCRVLLRYTGERPGQ